MKIFVCIGLAIIIVLIGISLWVDACKTCCNGQPCKPTTTEHSTQDQEYWQRMMCTQSRYRHLDKCKPFYKE